MSNHSQVSKWGNSLAVRIPRGIAKEARLAEGDRLTLNLATDGSIVLRSARRKYELRQLVSRITARNRHSETEWGTPMGRESW
ncbi:MAG: AbrB/MazE/SpoVT family DNA-binding domain-containing protein [Bryobacteraceae bacterium]|jgi:antitoxin MazE